MSSRLEIENFQVSATTPTIIKVVFSFKMISGNTILLRRRKLVELLPQLHPRTFQRIRVVTPVAPARRNRQDG